LHESASQGKLRSMKDDIFRWKIAITSNTSSDKQGLTNSGVLQCDE